MISGRKNWMSNTQDTYGSRIRNLLTPIANTVAVIDSYNTGEIDKETFLKFITQENLQYTLTSLIEISKEKILEETVYLK
jgi:hypothetical protein